MLVERTAGAVVESERNVVVMNQPANSHNDGNGQEEQINVAGKQQIDLEGLRCQRFTILVQNTRRDKNGRRYN